MTYVLIYRNALHRDVFHTDRHSEIQEQKGNHSLVEVKSTYQRHESTQSVVNLVNDNHLHHG